MKVAIDRAGRIVIPKDIRRAAGLEGPREVDVRVENGAIVIEPALVPMPLVKRGAVTVAEPVTRTPPLSEEAVNATVNETREERMRDAWSSGSTPAR